MLTIVLVSLFIVIFSLWWYLNTKIPEKFPPGPPRYPIFGSSRYMLVPGENGSKGSLIHGVFENVKKYGKIVGFYMGSQPWVVVADYKIMKDLLKRDEVSGRPSVVPFNEFRPGHSTVGNDSKGRNPGVLLSQGRGWREQRRFLLRNLRDFGFGKSEMEDTLLYEIEKLCNEYKKLVGKPVCLDNTLNLSIVNALWAILVGEKLPLNDPKILKIVTSFNKILKESSGAGRLIGLLPRRLALLLIKLLKLDVFGETIDSIAEMIENQVKAHRTTFDVDDIRDMTDLFLKEIGNTDDKDSSFYKERGHFNLINNFIDLFLAGMETTSTTLLWTFFYLLHHPDVKNKIHEELDKVVGPTNTPSLAHRDHMHYTNAMLHESLRMSCLVPLALPHYTHEDVTVGPYIIPKGTTIIPSLMSVHLDPEHFHDPHRFDPTRFLDENGEFKPDEHVVSFSIGKRFCLGQSLAEKEFFLFFVGIMQRFDINPEPNQELPSYHIKDSTARGTIRSAPSFNLILTERNI